MSWVGYTKVPGSSPVQKPCAEVMCRGYVQKSRIGDIQVTQIDLHLQMDRVVIVQIFESNISIK